MGRFISIGRTERAAPPFVWKSRDVEPQFVKVAVSASTPVFTAPEPMRVPTSTSEPVPAITPEPVVVPTPMSVPVPTPPVADMTGYTPEPFPSPETMATVRDVTPQPAPRTPLSQNLLSVRRRLNLTPEEFSRPIIEDGEGLINRLEAGFSRPSAEVTNLICDTWGITSSFLFSGTGPMFLKDETESTEKYVVLLIRLLNQYLSVATFDKHGNQYWNGSLVDNLVRMIDVRKLDGRGMSRVVKVLFDHLDVIQFEDILDRFGRRIH